jgi:polyisoprenoid-binding protein YceI
MKRCTLCVALAGSALALGSLALLAGAGSTAAQPAAASNAPAGAFNVDAVHSSVIFRCVRANGAPFYGRFNEISGFFTIDEANPANSRLEVTIPAASVDTNNQGRDRHLRNADFFSAEEFPNLTFKSTKWESAGADAWTVTGDLTARGVTKPVTVTVKKTGTGPARRGGTMFGADVTFTIKRTDFGISYQPQALSDEVQLMIGLEGTKQ